MPVSDPVFFLNQIKIAIQKLIKLFQAMVIKKFKRNAQADALVRDMGLSQTER